MGEDLTTANQADTFLKKEYGKGGGVAFLPIRPPHGAYYRFREVKSSQLLGGKNADAISFFYN